MLNSLKNDIAQFADKYPNIKEVKAEYQSPRGLTEDILILTWKWEDNNIDFAVDFPCTRRQNDLIWVIVDRLKISSHIIPVKATFSME